MAYVLACSAAQQLHRHGIEYASSSDAPPPPFDALIELGLIPPPQPGQRKKKPMDPSAQALYEYHLVGREAGGYVGPLIDARGRLSAGGSSSYMLKHLRKRGTGSNEEENEDYNPSEKSLNDLTVMYNNSSQSDDDMVKNLFGDARDRIAQGDTGSLMVMRMHQAAGGREQEGPTNGEEEVPHCVVVERMGGADAQRGASGNGVGSSPGSASGSAAGSSGKSPAVQLPEPLTGLKTVVGLIAKHFSQADLDNSTMTPEMLGSDQTSPTLAVLTRGHLCTALSRVLLHGFKAQGRFHVWDFILESCRDMHHRGVANETEKMLLAAVIEVNSDDTLGTDANVKFRSFTCSALNIGMVPAWIAALTQDLDLVGVYYENWAFIHPSLDSHRQTLDILKPLDAFAFALTLDYEYVAAQRARETAKQKEVLDVKVIATPSASKASSSGSARRSPGGVDYL